MNKTVTIESMNHKYANTYGGLSVSPIFVLTMKEVKILQIKSLLLGDLIDHVTCK